MEVISIDRIGYLEKKGLILLFEHIWYLIESTVESCYKFKLIKYLDNNISIISDFL